MRCFIQRRTFIIEQKNLCFSMFEKEPVVVGGTISQPHRGMSKGFAKQKMRILATKLEHIASRLSM